MPGLLSNVATIDARQGADQQQPGERPAGLRGLRRRPRPRLGGVVHRHPQDRGRAATELKPGNIIQVVGQIQSMDESFRDLGIGLLFAAVFVFALMVVNYQNFGDPFVVMLALPATLCGILVMLFITGTTLSVPSLMGAIMAVGVASANSILLVTFAHQQQPAGRSSFQAAIDAGHTRIRPVLMTAAAMIVGMLPWRSGALARSRTRRSPVRSSVACCSRRRRPCSSCRIFSPCCERSNDGKTPHGIFEEDIA